MQFSDGKFITGILPLFIVILLSSCIKEHELEISVEFQARAGQMQLDSLKRALIAQDGVENVAIDPDFGKITVSYDRFQTSDKKILSIITDVGISPSSVTKKPSVKD